MPLRRRFTDLGAALGLLLLAACAGNSQRGAAPGRGANSARAPAAGVKIGKPYVVFGKTYVPADDRHYDATGIASWYGPTFHAKATANGEIYNQDDITAAHKTLPMPSWVEVHNLDNGRKLTVRINDRGPFVDGRIIDLSRRSAQLLGVDGPGLARVRVKRVFPPEDWARAQPVLAASTVPAAQPRQPAPLATATPAPVAASGRYIQVAALSDESRARALASVMADFGPAQATPTGSGLWRVRIGPVAADRLGAILFEVRAGGWPEALVVNP